jgi:hypothetical protein
MNTIVVVNGTDRDWTRHRYILWFGAYGWTRAMVWADSLDDALDVACDWLAEHAPGLLADEQVAEEYRLAIAEGLDDEAAGARAAVDATPCGDGHWILSWEWGVVAEDPTRAEVLAMVRP